MEGAKRMTRVPRREMMQWAAGAAATAMIGGTASAQTPDALTLIGDMAAKLLPAKPLNMVRTVAAILELERKADQLGLPFSPLDAIKPPPLVPVEGSFYQGAVPRLVSLIDRSEEKDPATAEKAGELLADVHAAEHVVPDALKPAPLRLSTAHNFAALKSEYRTLFETAEIRAEHADALDWQAKLIAGSRERYEKVGEEVKVPWYFIGAIHGLEASFNFRAHLHNGDFPLVRRTRQVPAGRPLVWLPPSDWASSAKDALKLLGFTGQTDWSLERTLYRLEAYNGFGYRKRLTPTPYLWCFSNHYERGKFIADGKWNPTARSRQCGAAVVLKALVNAGEVKFT